MGALFDLDGVLVDTEPVYTELWNEIDRRFPSGYDNFALRIKGTTLPQILERYYPDASTQRKVVELLAEHEENMRFPIFDGVPEFLDELAAAGVPSVIVTSSNAAKMARLGSHEPRFMKHFTAVITDADVTHSKPHPEGYLLGAARCGAPADKCIVFEDSFAGLEAGRAAGAALVALSTTNPRETLTDKADVVAGSFAGLRLGELLEALREAGRSF